MIRCAVAVLAILGGLPPAFADPPVQGAPAETQGTAAQKSGDQQPNSASQAAAAPSATAAATAPAVNKANTTASASDESQQEALLRYQGYKPAMKNGEKVFCRREAPMGSRLPSALHCVTVQEAELMAKEGRETTERFQRGMAGCLPKAVGGCGN